MTETDCGILRIDCICPEIETGDEYLAAISTSVRTTVVSFCAYTLVINNITTTVKSPLFMILKIKKFIVIN